MRLLRNTLTSDSYATHGVLYDDDGSVLAGATLEPPTPIPVGRYGWRVYHSPRFGYDVILLENVPGHEGVELHRGNFQHDTHLCILVGQRMEVGPDPYTKQSEQIITGSRVTFTKMMSLLAARGQTAGILDIETSLEG